MSRVRGPKDNYIPTGEWPTALDINLQRLNPYVIEAEIFEGVIRVISLKTIIKLSIETGKSYGQNWTMTDLNILNGIVMALESDFSMDVSSIQKFILEKLSENYDMEDLTSVMIKIEQSEAQILMKKLPYLTDVEYKRLIEHQKKKKRKLR